jgi:3D-(3,5/4)-trihydroxycyclohexane-1,2-dione acylhydrolase (decyclizing)
VICFVGDGSYMLANSELATAVMRRVPYTIVLTDNRGYGCINRLQQECGGAEFNNMYKDSNVEAQPEIDFVAHAASMGAHAEKAADIADLEARIVAARGRDIPTVIVIDTDVKSLIFCHVPSFLCLGQGSALPSNPRLLYACKD